MLFIETYNVLGIDFVFIKNNKHSLGCQNFVVWIQFTCIQKVLWRPHLLHKYRYQYRHHARNSKLMVLWVEVGSVVIHKWVPNFLAQNLNRFGIFLFVHVVEMCFVRWPLCTQIMYAQTVPFGFLHHPSNNHDSNENSLLHLLLGSLHSARS